MSAGNAKGLPAVNPGVKMSVTKCQASPPARSTTVLVPARPLPPSPPLPPIVIPLSTHALSLSLSRPPARPPLPPRFLRLSSLPSVENSRELASLDLVPSRTMVRFRGGETRGASWSPEESRFAAPTLAELASAARRPRSSLSPRGAETAGFIGSLVSSGRC